MLPWRLDPSWVTLKIWWWTHSRRTDVLHVHSRVIDRVKANLDAAGIDLPFETVVQLWHDETDGSKGGAAEGGAGRPRPARGPTKRSLPRRGQSEDEFAGDPG